MANDLAVALDGDRSIALLSSAGAVAAILTGFLADGVLRCTLPIVTGGILTATLLIAATAAGREHRR